MDLTYLKRIINARNAARADYNHPLTVAVMNDSVERAYRFVDQMFENDIKAEVNRLCKGAI